MILDIKKLTQSKNFKAIMAIILALIILSGVFQAGVLFGFSKASFLSNFGDNYYRNFGENGNFMGYKMGKGMMFRNEFGGHGVIGKIIKVDLPNIIVLGKDNVEKIIVTNASTTVHQFRDVSSTDKLAIDQIVTVLGNPDEKGQIQAKFIRIMPNNINMPMMNGVDIFFNDTYSSPTKSKI